MILSMSKEYGIYTEQWEQKAGTNTEADMPTPRIRMKKQAPLDAHNKEYMKWKCHSQWLQLNQCKDFIKVCRFQ